MIILVAYLHAPLNMIKRDEYIQNFKQIWFDAMDNEEMKEVKSFVIPIHDETHSYIDCVYPKFIVAESDELKKEFVKYEQMVTKLTEFIKIYSEKM